MNDIDKAIKKHRNNSFMLKSLYLGNKNISYEKSKEIQNMQEKEWKKLMFLKKMQKELYKKKEEK